MSPPVLQIRDLRVRFDTDDGPVLAVNGLSLTVHESEVLALVGESGCGKSLTALSVLGLEPRHARVTGSVAFGGQDLRKLRARQLQRIRGRDLAMIFQEPMTSLNPVFTVGRQIVETLRRHQRLSAGAARERAVELLDLVRVPDARRRINDFPHQLSGGMRQRVMIAMAVACNPKLIIADEPTTALDVTVQAQVLDILRDLRREFGTAIILITHNLGVVADIADNVVVMYAGHEIENGTVETLFDRPQHPYTMGLLGAVPRPGARERGELAEIPGRVPILRAEPTECVFAPRCSRAEDDCTRAMPALREAQSGQHVACLHPGHREAVSQ
jgi:peptide/nickel transport system ATP-binding protein